MVLENVFPVLLPLPSCSCNPSSQGGFAFVGVRRNGLGAICCGGTGHIGCNVVDAVFVFIVSHRLAFVVTAVIVVMAAAHTRASGCVRGGHGTAHVPVPFFLKVYVWVSGMTAMWVLTIFAWSATP